ncbi:MAG: hypothetical protein FJ291_24670 [Planctomycetes bacterium]|nr:hypothetical protein [Planctomycetota bacterium]
MNAARVLLVTGALVGFAAVSGGEPSAAALKAVERAEVPEALRSAMTTVLRQHPAEARWSGRHERSLFAVATLALPKGDLKERSTPAFLGAAHTRAVQELLKAKSLLHHYAAAGLDESTTLCQAVTDAAGELEVTGTVKGLTHQASVQDDSAVAYVIADAASLTAHLLQPGQLEKVKTAYRNVMHREARELMKRQNWQDAVLLWHHLHARRLVSQALYLDAATCFLELRKPEEALKVLKEAYAAFSALASAEWLEQCGDLACRAGKLGEPLALEAYQTASAALLSTTSNRARPKQVEQPKPPKP